MKLSKAFFVCALMLIATTALAKQEKQLVCHVGNETGPAGEEYVDDPGCMPIEENGYFCPDAGKIDLISVAKVNKHLENPSHTYDGISDYLPEDVGASGEGDEDSDGDGVDDGCQPPPEGFSATQTIQGRTVTCSSATTNDTYTECLDLKADGLSFPNGIACGPFWSTTESRYTSLADFCEYITGSPSFEVYYQCEPTTARATWFGSDWGANVNDNGFSRHLRCNY